MKKRIICVMLLCVLLFSMCACDYNIRGKLLILEEYRPNALLKAYNEFANGERKINYTLGEEKPSLRACITNEAGIFSPTLDIYVVNESRFDVVIHGYTWITNNLKEEGTCQAIYFHRQKHVSNASYEIHMDTLHNDYLSFEVLNEKGLICPSVDSVAFLFFKYEDTEYVGGLKMSGDFICWPLVDTLPGKSESTEK